MTDDQLIERIDAAIQSNDWETADRLMAELDAAAEDEAVRSYAAFLNVEL